MLLEPDQQILCQLGLDMESMLLNDEKNDSTTVPLLNYDMDAKHLVKGQVVGTKPDTVSKLYDVLKFYANVFVF